MKSDLIFALVCGCCAFGYLTYALFLHIIIPHWSRSAAANAGQPLLLQFVRLFSEPVQRFASKELQKKFDQYDKLLLCAGTFMNGFGAADIYVSKYVFGFAGCVMTSLFLMLLDAPAFLIFCSAIVVGVLMFIYPEDALKTQVAVRSAKFVSQLPNALDLMRLIVQSGGNFNSAINCVVDNYIPGPVKEEFVSLKNELALGSSIQKSLLNIADRIQAPEASSVFVTLSQSMEMGTSISENLGDVANRIRKQQRTAAQEHAQKAVVKMSFPLLLLILPGVFIVLLGPVIVQFTKI